MSIKLIIENCWVISHQIDIETNDGHKYMLNPSLFQIHVPFKHKTDSKTLGVVSKLVKSLWEEVLNSEEFIDNNFFDKPEEYVNNNDNAVKTAKDFYAIMSDFNLGKFNGGNTNEQFGVFGKVKDHQFIFPKNSRFFCGDVLEIIQDGNFDLVVLDPPWWNKFIRRKRKHSDSGYSLMDTSTIEKIPIKNITTKNAIIAVWCTNSSSIQKKLIDEIFPKWGLHWVTTWYWLKVTTAYTPICPFEDDNKKQPYEALIIGSRTNRDTMDTKLIVSVPSSIHSHKPPLFEILQNTFNVSDNFCEIFARYLYPNVISYGNEVIKLQHSSLFV